MMYAQFPIKGVVYPSETEIVAAIKHGCSLEKSAGDLVRHRASSLMHKPFLISGKGTTTYSQFDESTEILAAALLNLGLLPGDRAIFQMGTVEETLIALFGCYKAGIIPVCTLPQHREQEIAAMIKLTAPRAHFIQSDFSTSFDLFEFATEMAGRYGSVEHIIPTDISSISLHNLARSVDYNMARERLSDIKVNARDVLTFQLSGGSTGTPKIIPRFHGEYLGQANGIVGRYLLESADIAIWPLPLIHNAAMVMVIFPILLSGGTIVLQHRFELHAFLKAIETHKVTFAGSIGPIAQSLLDYQDLSTHDLSSLRMFFALDRADAIERHLNVPTANLYGITEGLLMTCRPDDPSEIRLSSSGYPTGIDDKIRLFVPDSEKPIENGSEGELCFRGPHTIRGYYNAPQINAESFTSDGYFRSGDLVRISSHNGKTVFTFLGRLKDNISRGGEKIAAEEVERMVVMHPTIVDAKVVAMPDRLLGEKACVFVVVRSGQRSPTKRELSAFLTEGGLARYKHPERIEVIKEFPLTRIGKVDKAAMRQLVAQRLAEEEPSSSATGRDADHLGEGL
jgi:non-ribosomal peptide synthetase component E (peptide arylation enzyme)